MTDNRDNHLQPGDEGECQLEKNGCSNLEIEQLRL